MGYGPDWSMMGGWGWMGAFNMIIWLAILVLIVAAVMWLVRSASHTSNPPRVERRSSGLDVLEERYARGEINRDEYLQKKQDLSR